jgi:hypothetical protein
MKVGSATAECHLFLGPIAVDAWSEFVGGFAAASRAWPSRYKSPNRHHEKARKALQS